MHQERYRKEEEGSNCNEEDVWDQYVWKYQQDIWQSEVAWAEVQFPPILQIYVWIHQMWSIVKSVVNIVLLDKSSTYNKFVWKYQLWQIRRKGIRYLNQLLTQIPRGKNLSSTIYSRFRGYPIGVNTERSCQNFATKWLRCKNWKVLMEFKNLENKYLPSCNRILFQMVIHQEWNLFSLS